MDLDSGRFSGHQSFTVRNTWPTKGALECADNPRIFVQPDALVVLGVGKNMVDAIRYWCLAMRLIEDVPGERGACRPTLLGNRVFVADGGWDRYLEDTGTIWLLHWLLATNPAQATTIYFALNALNIPEFTRDSLEQEVTRLAEQMGARATPNSIRRDVNVFIRSYMGGADRATASVEESYDCPLAELGLLNEEPVGHTYAFVRGPKESLPDAVVVYAVGEYVARAGRRQTFSFDELAYRPMSPGRVFKLDELALAERLERVADLTQGAWQFADSAGYRQVLIGRDVDPIAVLDGYYAGRGDVDARS